MQQVYNFLLRTRWTRLQVWKHPWNTLTLVWKYFISIVSQKGSELLHRTIRLNVKLVCQSNSNPPCWRKKKHICFNKNSLQSSAWTTEINWNFRSLHTSGTEQIWTSKDLSPNHLAQNRCLTQGQKRAWSGPVWSGLARTRLKRRRCR